MGNGKVADLVVVVDVDLLMFCRFLVFKKRDAGLPNTGQYSLPQRKAESHRMAAVCIRCGSKEHSTRDHDEGKVAGLPPAPKKSKPKKEPVSDASGKIKHKTCWASVGRRPGIPDIVEKPLIDRWTTPPMDDPWFCKRSVDCDCVKCDKKREKLRLAALRRLGKDV